MEGGRRAKLRRTDSPQCLACTVGTACSAVSQVASITSLALMRLSRASGQALEECRPDTPCSCEHPTCGRAQVLNINAGKTDIDSFVFEDFELVGYQPHKKIAMELAV